jgi:hypothetical protein
LPRELAARAVNGITARPAHGRDEIGTCQYVAEALDRLR